MLHPRTAHIVLLAAFFLLHCQPSSDKKKTNTPITHPFTLIDTHIDAPLHQLKKWIDLTDTIPDRDFDYPRARQGGLDVAFMSIWVNPKLQTTEKLKPRADTLIDLVERLGREHPDKFEIITSSEEARNAHEDSTLLLPLGIENGAAIDSQLQNLQHFYDRGVRYITLTHGKHNYIGDSSYDDDSLWGGLSPFGRKVVRKMNELGIIIDISHVTDATFWDVMEITEAPVIASHSSCRVATPGWERNMSDTLIKALAENGGVININFGSSFVDSTFLNGYKKVLKKRDSFKKEHDLPKHHPKVDSFKRARFKAADLEKASVEDVADQVDHVVELVGVEHVGIGSDYDGLGPTLPNGLEDVSTYPALFHELQQRGYSDAELAQIAGQNLLRVWQEVEEVSKQSS